MDTIRLVKQYNYHPMIANIQLGDIEYWKLCDSAGITSQEKCSIISFDLGYMGKAGFVEKHINGNNIPDSICTEIGTYGLNYMLFFTKIKAMSHSTYRMMYLTSMNLMPIKSED